MTVTAPQQSNEMQAVVTPICISSMSVRHNKLEPEKVPSWAAVQLSRSASCTNSGWYDIEGQRNPIEKVTDWAGMETKSRIQPSCSGDIGGGWNGGECRIQ